MTWRMVAHGFWTCGQWTASRYVSGGWLLSADGGQTGRVYRSLKECQKVVKR